MGGLIGILRSMFVFLAQRYNGPRASVPAYMLLQYKSIYAFFVTVDVGYAEG